MKTRSQILGKNGPENIGLPSQRPTLQCLVDIAEIPGSANARCCWAIDSAARGGWTVAHVLNKSRGETAALLRIGPAGPNGILLACELAAPEKTETPKLRITSETGRFQGGGLAGSGAILAATLAETSNLSQTLRYPIWLAIYPSRSNAPDQIVDWLSESHLRPRLVIDAQATALWPVAAHPGDVHFRARFHGTSFGGHPPWAGVNASEVATRYGMRLIELRSELMLRPGQATLALNGLYAPPESSHQAAQADLYWSMSYWKSIDLGFVRDELDLLVSQSLEPGMKALDPQSGIAQETLLHRPPLRTSQSLDADIEPIFRASTRTLQIAGNGGIWQRLGVPALAFGPGSQSGLERHGNQITLRDLAACSALLRRVITRLGRT